MSDRKQRSALRAAAYGYAVLPLNWATNGRCSCGDPCCSSVGKHPLTSRGVYDATTDVSIIRDWWRKYPKANIGIATGQVSGVIVVDIDLRHDGTKSLQDFEKENGPLPEGPVVKTGGGFHRYFKYSKGVIGNKTGLLPGIDVKSDGGYVVYPGSEHESGQRYVWLSDKSPRKVAAPPFPASLLRLASVRKILVAPESQFKIPQGQRNSTLTSLAGAMRRKTFSEEAIQAALLVENALRCCPPLSDAEVIGIAHNVARYAPADPSILSSAPKDIEAKERKLRFRTGAEIAKETPADVPWVFKPLIAFGAITELGGKVKQGGKTTFATHLVAKILAGLPFMNQSTAQTAVVYLTEQSPTSFRATMERAGLLGRDDLFVLFWADTIGVAWESVVHAAVAECKRRKARLLVVDTLPQFANLIGDSENSAGDALRAIQPLQQAAAEGIAVLIVRHERKSGGALGDSGRGSSAFAGAVDILISIRRPEGNHPPSVRLIQSISRFDAADDLLIEFSENGYAALGSPGEGAKQRAADDVLSVIPKSKNNAIAIDGLAKATGKKRAHLQTLLDVLVETKKISKLGKGRKGDPYRYFRS